MILAAPLLLLAAQAADSAGERPAEQDRLTACLDQAGKDPATAIARASEWLAHAHDAGRALPQQCLGQAYVSLLRWDAAHDAFIAARDAALPSDSLTRARLGAMAGNAALAGGEPAVALADLGKAVGDATLAGNAALAGSIGADEARALVALGRDSEAAEALAKDRAAAPQNAEAWLLSATLSRRMGDLKAAEAQIATAAALAKTDPAIGLEAGVIA